MSSEMVKEDAGMLDELGATGLEQYGGIISEEFLRQLNGRMGREVFREMSNNDAIIGAMLYAVEMLIRPATWSVDPFDDSPKAIEDAAFIDTIFGDMSHSWDSFLGEWMACPVYGFAPFEMVFKMRRGWDDNPDLRSKYKDGKVGLSKLAIRHPDTLDHWMFDAETGDRVIAMVQNAAPRFNRVEIPMEKMLLFTVLQRKGNPEGTSLIRRAYLAWYRKKRIEEIEAIGVERELAGLPMIYTPHSWWLPGASAHQKNLLAQMKRIGKRVRSDEQACVVLPHIPDEQGNKMLTFELVSTGGRRAIDTAPTKEYYSRQMAMTILADVILLGHEQVGSFALASSKTNLFAAGLGALLDSIEETLNRDLIPKLMTLNGRPPDQSPALRHGDVETPDLGVLGKYISDLAGAGFPLFPTEDGELERELLRAGNMPESAGSAESLALTGTEETDEPPETP